LSEIKQIVEDWKRKINGKDTSPRWQDLHLMIIEIEQQLPKIIENEYQ
jgi:hypothetical protein